MFKGKRDSRSVRRKSDSIIKAGSTARDFGTSHEADILRAFVAHVFQQRQFSREDELGDLLDQPRTSARHKGSR